MKSIRFKGLRFAMLFCSAIIGLQFQLGLAMVCAQDEADEESKNKDRFEYMIKATSRFEARVGDSKKRARLDENSLFRWTNPTDTVVDGLLVLYTQGAGTRPVVVSDYHVHSSGFEVQEFIPIVPDLVMNDGRVDFWKPLSLQGEFKVLPEAAAVGTESPTRRLVQMKALANRFELNTDVGKKKGERYALRMLPRPIYRYGQPESQITDGAVFMWSRGTDPDAILLIELQSIDGKTEWHYGLFPVSIHSLSASLDGEVVWVKPRIQGFNDRSGPHFVGPYRRAADDAPIKPLLPKP